MASVTHFLKNVGGLVFVSLFVLYTFMTQANETGDPAVVSASTQASSHFMTDQSRLMQPKAQ